ncbi:MAG TPA: hypothetical protein VJ743_22095 [Albitalea sp.]|nr:hypothetical protein [Albitalea sp.]
MKLRRLVQRISAISLPVALAACGGGSDSSPPAAPTVTSLRVTGTAAVGAAMPGASVSVTCASGSGTATADANGVYTVSITNGALPCVLTATSSDGLTQLHSVAPGTGHADTTANITPLSELLVARLAGTDPAAYVAAFTGTTPIAAADVSAAQAAVLQTLTASGVDVSAVSDIVGGSITAGSASGYDGALDGLQAALVIAGTTLDELSTAVSTTSSAGASTSTSTVATVLAPAAADCPGLKSGTLRVLDFVNGGNGLVQVDATALTATMGGATYTLTKNASCDYTLNDSAATRVLVARSGIAVLLQGSGASGVGGVAFPDQTLDVAALAGTYDRVQYGSTIDAEAGDFGTTVFAADGSNGLSVNCPLGYGNCVEDTLPKGTLVANPAGGFDYMENGASQARVFGFRNASGRNLLIAQAPDGTIVVLAAQNALALPAVGKVSSFWQFTVNGAGLGAVSSDSSTVTAVDATAKTAVRQFASDSHFDTLGFDSPFAGTRYRATNACTTAAGGALNCNGVVQLPYGGIVLSVSAVSTKHFMTVSIDKP